MKKILLRILILCTLLCMILPPQSVSGMERVDVARKCSLALEYSRDGLGFSGLEIRIFRVAEMYEDGTYALVAPYSGFPVTIHGIRSQQEWREAANTLAAYIGSRQVPATKQAFTDESGKVAFSDLTTGIYLVMGVTAETEKATYTFENFCVFLPRPSSDGRMEYALEAKPKSEYKPKPEEIKEIELKVTKLWKDTGYKSKRPKSVKVDILKDGVVQETVTLNSANNWTYTWKAPEDDSVWSAVEKDVPDAYKVTIDPKGTTITITNTRSSSGGDPPKTGDTFALRPWVMTMSLSGIALAVLGVLGKRKRR